MDIDYYQRRLTTQAEAIARLIESVDGEQARWRPTADDWSILEVINHLYDEEVEDFRIRLELTLSEPTADWPPNDPEQKVKERDYNARDLADSLENFLDERTVSLEWLSHLGASNWDAAHTLAPGIELRAGDIMASWVAHDLLHLRQLIELHYSYQSQLALPYSVDYAGAW